MAVMYDRYVGHVLSNVHVPGSGPIWLDDVLCTDSCHTKLNQCTHAGWGIHNCTHAQDVSITCYDHTTTNVPMTTTRTTTTSNITTSTTIT